MMEDHDVLIAEARHKRETSHLISVLGVHDDNSYKEVIANIEWVNGVGEGCMCDRLMAGGLYPLALTLHVSKLHFF